MKVSRIEEMLEKEFFIQIFFFSMTLRNILFKVLVSPDNRQRLASAVSNTGSMEGRTYTVSFYTR